MSDDATKIAQDPRIEADTRARLVRLADDPAAIAARIAVLDKEWDLERVRDANAVAFSVIGTGLTLLRRARLLRLNMPGLVAAFVFQHALQGAKPPVALLRRWGFRTREEIERERAALLVLLGSPSEIPPPPPGPRVTETLAATGRDLLARLPRPRVRKPR